MAELSQERIEETKERLARATPGPWEWIGSALTAGGVVYRQSILWPANCTNPDPYGMSPNETGPEWWAKFLGSCGKDTEPNAHNNAMLLSHCWSDIRDLLAEVERLRGKAGE